MKSLQARWTRSLAVALAFGMIGSVGFASSQWGGYALIGVVPGLALVAFVVNRIFQWDLERQRAWLRSLPYAAPLPDYEAILSQTYLFTAQLVVEAEFKEPLPLERLETLRAAAVGALRGASAAFDGDRLCIVSPPLKTAFSGRTSTYDNVRLHRWFRRCAERALRPIHEAHALARIRVRVR